MLIRTVGALLLALFALGCSAPEEPVVEPEPEVTGEEPATLPNTRMPAPP